MVCNANLQQVKVGCKQERQTLLTKKANLYSHNLQNVLSNVQNTPLPINGSASMAIICLRQNSILA